MVRGFSLPPHNIPHGNFYSKGCSCSHSLNPLLKQSLMKKIIWVISAQKDIKHCGK
jgi:hypothetical protein